MPYIVLYKNDWIIWIIYIVNDWIIYIILYKNDWIQLYVVMLLWLIRMKTWY